MTSANLTPGDAQPSAPAGVSVEAGGPIVVTTRQLAHKLIVYEITAAVGDHVETQQFSIGDGGSTPKQTAAMTATELQEWLDDKRQTVADNVAWHVAMESAGSQVQ
jgi:hypothetical protein